MKAIAIDTSISSITISVINEEKKASTILNIGMKQSETLLPAIDNVMQYAGLEKEELEFAVISKGPGSFTGLRLGFAAVKALECAYRIPVYGLDSLKIWAKEFENFNKPVLSVIDAKKDKFYAALYNEGQCTKESGDYTKEEIFSFIKDKKELIVTGPDALMFEKLINEDLPEIKTYAPTILADISESMFILAVEMKDNGESPLKPFDGPEYLRDSDAKISETPVAQVH